ncbi:MAG: class I SAM-dependent methyltransferase [bacterium]
MSTLVLLLLLGGILGVFGTAAWAGIRAAPWLPTRAKDIRRLLDLAELKPGELLYDLGCGDGRVLMIAAKEYGARAVGFEISLLPYLAAKARTIFHPSRRNIQIRFEDFYHTSLSQADVVFCFLTPSAMKRLKTKFVQELHPGARVASSTFSFDGLPGAVRVKPEEKTIAVHLYRHPL